MKNTTYTEILYDLHPTDLRANGLRVALAYNQYCTLHEYCNKEARHTQLDEAHTT
jgi:hypothetical protein